MSGVVHVLSASITSALAIKPSTVYVLRVENTQTRDVWHIRRCFSEFCDLRERMIFLIDGAHGGGGGGGGGGGSAALATLGVTGGGSPPTSTSSPLVQQLQQQQQQQQYTSSPTAALTAMRLLSLGGGRTDSPGRRRGSGSSSNGGGHGPMPERYPYIYAKFPRRQFFGSRTKKVIEQRTLGLNQFLQEALWFLREVKHQHKIAMYFGLMTQLETFFDCAAHAPGGSTTTATTRGAGAASNEHRPLSYGLLVPPPSAATLRRGDRDDEEDDEDDDNNDRHRRTYHRRCHPRLEPGEPEFLTAPVRLEFGAAAGGGRGGPLSSSSSSLKRTTADQAWAIAARGFSTASGDGDDDRMTMRTMTSTIEHDEHDNNRRHHELSDDEDEDYEERKVLKKTISCFLSREVQERRLSTRPRASGASRMPAPASHEPLRATYHHDGDLSTRASERDPRIAAADAWAARIEIAGIPSVAALRRRNSQQQAVLLQQYVDRHPPLQEQPPHYRKTTKMMTASTRSLVKTATAGASTSTGEQTTIVYSMNDALGPERRECMT